MRRHRARRRAAGLRSARAWVPAEPVWSDHRVAEARSLALHVLAARHIAAKPALMQLLRGTVARWASRDAGTAAAALAEWQALLERPWAEVCARATELSERGARLRQSSPFATLLTPAERKRVHDAFRA